ncbi:related to Mediator of RNA polymerase II transcription subunit 7 [Saccharomycodes ludwigii]|uniref:Mediator of RNA polymerase II transcription subunit 7 n=1 Tax=Saccharomycodes ludwigii TaxID=36035 RepID=A0A376B4U5_9ASCO|nr:hypothetical protein SCDLUD_005006 [Saccharomycodes ludwigii]KAH3898683.1 hypothetical protein SCDLUD_005006 [Saccharomycodes ludwigii]SSD59708.1 related to Mediator of RNA polymerase II transcription subunit 7 [Saccharomycodes ludwigii]
MTDSSNDISSLYPPPPSFYKYFTKQNLEKLQHLAATESNNKDEKENILNNDPELQYLIPPPLPEDGRYRSFGNIWQLKDELPDLKQVGIPQLYKNNDTQDYTDKIKQLKILVKSLLLNFLELTGLLSLDPSQYEKKLEHIRIILINIHHLLNEYRPHQTRESLIMLLEDQLAFKRKEINNIKLVCKQVEEKLKEISELPINDNDANLTTSSS